MTYRAGWVGRAALAFVAFAVAAAVVAVEIPRPAGAAPPAVTVSPSTGLGDRQRVLVRGTGMPAGPLDVIECPTAEAGTTACSIGAYPHTVGGAVPPGALALVLRVSRDVGDVDCATAAGTCSIVVQAGPSVVATLALAFDRSKPPHAPRNGTVTPATNLRDFQAVRFTASGFAPDADLEASECTHAGFPIGNGFCNTISQRFTPGSIAVDANGNTSTVVIVRQVLSTVDVTVDCAIAPCYIRLAGRVDPSDLATADLAFAPNPTPLTPTVHASPATNLPALAPITASGAGFLPGATLRVMEYIAGQTVDASGDHCALGPRATVTTDGSGAFSTQVGVWRNIKPFVGPNPVDCASAPGACLLAAVGVDDPTTATAPLGFNPSAPPPPAPTISVAPTQGLGVFPVVTVKGAHFAPGDNVGVTQHDSSGRIRLPAGAPVAADGTFSRTVTLGRTVSDRVNGVLPPADCATVPSGCSLDVKNVTSGGGTVPISFDPNAVRPPPPVVTLTPVTSPGDEHLALALVRGAPPDMDIGLKECEPGTGAACDLDRAAGSAHTDASGRAAMLVPIFTSMMTVNGVTRCDLSPGACVLRLDDGDLDVLNTAIPIPFGPPQIVAGVGTVDEPASGTAVLNVPVTLSALSFAPVTVSYATADVSATAGLDYIAASGTITFAPLQTTATIPITVKSDLLDEPDEVVRVALSNPVGATVGGFFGLGFGLIVDATPPPVIVPGTVTTPEGGPGTHVVNVPIALSVPSAKTVTASWHTLDGSALAGSDYQAASGTLTFAPGETQKSVPVTIVADTIHEPTQVMFVAVTNPMNATVGGFYGLGAVAITEP